MQRRDNVTPIIYISGWKGKGPLSGSYLWLERHFTNTACYHAGGQTNVEKMVRELSDLIDSHRIKSRVEPILIGNSYGGFVASLFPQKQVLINPALFPAESLPHIADLTEDEIERFRLWQSRRSELFPDGPRDNVYTLCTEGDELIPDHRTEIVSTRPPVMIPGGAHRLTDLQRDTYLLPLILEVVNSD